MMTDNNKDLTAKNTKDAKENNFGSYPKTEIIRIANTRFRDFSDFRG